MEQLSILKNLLEEAKKGDEFGIKPDLTRTEIEALKWAIKQIESKCNAYYVNEV